VTISILVDSNILLDMLGGGEGIGWTRGKLVRHGAESDLVVNPIVWSEIGARYASEEELEDALKGLELEREPLPFAAAWRAGRAHALYRSRGGARERTLPDFLIGAHAEVAGHALLTRDPARYRSYFPDIDIIAPDTHP
jgi:predicted nucleic acid-binding protein